MNTQYTRHLSMIRRALSIGTLCLVASFGVAHAEDFAIPSARPVVDGMSTDDVKVDIQSVKDAGKTWSHYRYTRIYIR